MSDQRQRPGDPVPLRVLMLCYEYPPLGGGGARAVDGLARALGKLGHRVDLVTMGFRNLPRYESAEGVHVHRVPCLRFREHICSMVEAASYLQPAFGVARRLAARQPYDISHAHFILPDGANAERLRRATALPFIVTVHGSDVPGYNPDRLKLAHRVLAPVWQRVVRGASCVVCPSRSILALVNARRPPTATTIVSYGFDAPRFDVARPRHKRILVVTRMLKRKGVHDVLEALQGLALDHELHLVGDGPELAGLKRRAEGHTMRIVFHGWLDNRSAALTELYETSDLFVLPSESENFPVALLEAMAAGLAIVTTRGTGCEEVVGDAAVLVEPRSPAAIRSALVALTNDPGRARRLGRAARQRVEREFGWRGIAQQHVQVYRQFARRAARVAAGPAPAPA